MFGVFFEKHAIIVQRNSRTPPTHASLATTARPSYPIARADHHLHNIEDCHTGRVLCSRTKHRRLPLPHSPPPQPSTIPPRSHAPAPPNGPNTRAAVTRGHPRLQMRTPTARTVPPAPPRPPPPPPRRHCSSRSETRGSSPYPPARLGPSHEQVHAAGGGAHARKVYPPGLSLRATKQDARVNLETESHLEQAAAPAPLPRSHPVVAPPRATASRQPGGCRQSAGPRNIRCVFLNHSARAHVSGAGHRGAAAPQAVPGSEAQCPRSHSDSGIPHHVACVTQKFL